jgi:membrane protein insertase Oxa1/YidC/SpoIIIJ
LRFGLIPYDPTLLPVLGPFLMLGAWPLVMGVTMWFQMKLNPPPPDPTQAMNSTGCRSSSPSCWRASPPAW